MKEDRDADIMAVGVFRCQCLGEENDGERLQ